MPQLSNVIDECSVFITDFIVTIITFALVSSLAVWLCGCAAVGPFTAEDAQGATRIATAVGDSAGAACWPVLETTGNAISAVGNRPGILVAVEEKRAVQLALQNTACQPVWTDVLGELLKLTAAAPLVP
jgi:hypothetical protein